VENKKLVSQVQKIMKNETDPPPKASDSEEGPHTFTKTSQHTGRERKTLIG
jgi:hypothetical protein